MRWMRLLFFCGILLVPSAADAQAGQSRTASGALDSPNLHVLRGFKVELIHSAAPGEGSWICMTFDDRGRLIISPQDVDRDSIAPPSGLLRVSLATNAQMPQVERISLPVGTAMGLLFAFESLYLTGRGPNGLGFYRLRDTDANDQFDEISLLKKFDDGGVGEHGIHAIALGPEKKLYLMNGDYAKLPEVLAPVSPYRNFQNDLLLPALPDPGGVGAGLQPPGGHVLRTDIEGKEWELFCGGFRNCYDFDFNLEGELFTFDSDMEWDEGTPWYRPTRIVHVVSGGDYGFRENSGKWPVYYPDSLPAVVDVGRGSPTGVKFGTKSNFSAKYQQALYCCDWVFGRILAIHLIPSGASYQATVETFVTGKPLNVTDLEFGPDGAMYFITGGRGTQSGLYRLCCSHTDEDKKPFAEQPQNQAAQAKRLRRQLEAWHGKKDRASLDLIWPHLDSEDRWIRYAARIGLEFQEVDHWQERALGERRTNGSLTALLALARRGHQGLQGRLVNRLLRLDWASLTETQRLEALRVLSLAFIRMGDPEPGLTKMVRNRLASHYPSSSAALNRELCQLLVYLEDPSVLSKTLRLLKNTDSHQENLWHLYVLHHLTRGWSEQHRVTYFNWIRRGLEEFGGGLYVPKYLASIRREVWATLSQEEQAKLSPFSEEMTGPKTAPMARRGFVKEWTMGDLENELDRVSEQRSLEKGREAFASGQCFLCHRVAGEGGMVGPELTTSSSRFSNRDLLEAILDPSKVVPDQFRNTVLMLNDGSEIHGRVIEENIERIVLLADPLTESRVLVSKKDILMRRVSPISPMPEGLLNTLSKEEILDLLAYLRNGGKARISNHVN